MINQLPYNWLAIHVAHAQSSEKDKCVFLLFY